MITFAVDTLTTAATFVLPAVVLGATVMAAIAHVAAGRADDVARVTGRTTDLGGRVWYAAPVKAVAPITRSAVSYSPPSRGSTG